MGTLGKEAAWCVDGVLSTTQWREERKFKSILDVHSFERDRKWWSESEGCRPGSRVVTLRKQVRTFCSHYITLGFARRQPRDRFD